MWDIYDIQHGDFVVARPECIPALVEQAARIGVTLPETSLWWKRPHRVTDVARFLSRKPEQWERLNL